MEKRAILAAVLSLLVLFLWQAYIGKIRKPQEEPQPSPGSQPQKAVSPVTGTVPLPPEPTPSLPREVPIAERIIPEEKERLFAEEEIPVDMPLYHIVFSTLGGRIKSMKLKGFHESISPGSALVDIVAQQGLQALPLEISFLDSGHGFSSVSFTPDKKSIQIGKAGKEELTFIYKSRRGISVKKVFSFEADSYRIGLKVNVENLASTPLKGKMILRWMGNDEGEVSKYTYTGPVALIQGKLLTYSKKGGEAQEFNGDVRWAGFEDKYFIAAMIPRVGSQGVIFEPASTALIHPLVVIPPRGVLTNIYDLYLGPKELERLKALNVDLDRAIDYGWFHSIAKPLVLVLKALYSFSGNYGIAIFLLTLAVRLLFYPLNQMSYKSMKEMQKLQPKITELRDKYKDDKDKLNRETMELYRQHKVNPFGGCVPILIQIPVFIALYQALMKSIELRHAPFMLWIQDLSSPESLFTVCIIPSFCIPGRLLPLLMGITTFIQQKMTPTTGDPQQAKLMLWFMPIMLTVIFWGLPSGLVLYWTVNNILSIFQQYYINKKT